MENKGNNFNNSLKSNFMINNVLESYVNNMSKQCNDIASKIHNSKVVQGFSAACAFVSSLALSSICIDNHINGIDFFENSAGNVFLTVLGGSLFFAGASTCLLKSLKDDYYSKITLLSEASGCYEQNKNHIVEMRDNLNTDSKVNVAALDNNETKLQEETFEDKEENSATNIKIDKCISNETNHQQ